MDKSKNPSEDTSQQKSTPIISTKKVIDGKRGPGMPSKYNEKVHPLMARALAKTGMIDRDIAEEMTISEHTFIQWKKVHPEFLAALTEGKEIPDIQVEKALYKKALGFDTEEVELRPNRRDGSGKMDTVKVTRKQFAPDVIAQIFWLKNRRPDRWRDKQDIEHSGSVGYKIIPDDLPDEEIAPEKEEE